MKRFISLSIIFLLIMSSISLYAQKKGAEIIVQKKGKEMPDKQWKGTPWEKRTSGIRGELIAVKENSLLLLNDEGAVVLVDIKEIREITIVKKSKLFKGAGAGFLIGAGSLLGIGILFNEIFIGTEWRTKAALKIGLVGGGLGAIIGAGAASRKNKIYILEEMSPEGIKWVLEKLRSIARTPDYQ